MFIHREESFPVVFFGALLTIAAVTWVQMLASAVFAPALSTPAATHAIFGVLQVFGY